MSTTDIDKKKEKLYNTLSEFATMYTEWVSTEKDL